MIVEQVIHLEHAVLDAMSAISAIRALLDRALQRNMVARPTDEGR